MPPVPRDVLVEDAMTLVYMTSIAGTYEARVKNDKF